MLKIIFLMVMGFIAAVIDAIAGGSGLITIPAYMIAGLPPHLLLGTNKFAAFMGTAVSAGTYAKNDKIKWDLVLKLVPFSFLGAFFGVKTVLRIDPTILQPLIVIILIAVGIYTMVKPSIGEIDKYNGYNKKTLIYGMVFAFLLGFYDGFFGPGTGSFIIFGLVSIFGMNFVNASANSKILNLGSNIMSFILFMINGNIDYKIGILVGISMIAGAIVGSRMAIEKGNKLVKPIFIIMAIAAAVKVLRDTLI